MILEHRRFGVRAGIDLVAQFSAVFIILALLGFATGSAFGEYGNLGAWLAAGGCAALIAGHTYRKPQWIREVAEETVRDMKLAEMNRLKSLLGHSPKAHPIDDSFLLYHVGYGAIALGFSDQLVFPFVWLVILSCLLVAFRKSRRGKLIRNRLSIFWFLSWTCAAVCWLNASGNTRFNAWEMASLISTFACCALFEAWLLRGDLKRLPVVKAQMELLGVLETRICLIR